LTGHAAPPGGKDGAGKESSILSHPLDDTRTFVEAFVERLATCRCCSSKRYEPYDHKLAAISALLALVGAGAGAVVGIHPALMPLTGILLGSLPAGVAADAPQAAAEGFRFAIARRPGNARPVAPLGQSLGFGFNMVASEMPMPISKEFGRVFEEQNLGIPLDETLRAMTNRIPTSTSSSS